MADIAMCTNEECPSRKICYRAMAKPDTWQSYSAFTHESDSGKCVYFVEYNWYKGMKERSMDKYQIAERRLYIDFAHRVHEALKPGTKMWQKENKQPLCWPDPIRLIVWLTKKAKKGRLIFQPEGEKLC